MPFVANQGQLDPSVAFYARTFGGAVFVTTRREIVYSLPRRESDPAISGMALRESAVGGRTGAVAGRKPARCRITCFNGSEPARWRTAVKAYDEVVVLGVYDGIDLTLAARGDNVEKLFTVRPGADPRTIAMRIEGGTSLTVNDAGELIVEAEGGPVRFTRPVAYQPATSWTDSPGDRDTRTEVTAAYVVHGDQYGFRLGAYDPTRPVIIDPLLASTFLGGGGDDWGHRSARDADGNVYVVGETVSSDYPTTPGAYLETRPGGSSDVCISKFDADLTQLLASTFLGGSGSEEAYALVLDAAGDVYLTGTTSSSNFPTTAGAYDRTYNGGAYDAFVARLDGDLATLRSSTFLGGYADDYGHSLALGSAGSVVLVGETASANFPTSVGAYDRSLNGMHDAYVARLDSNLTTLQASTYLGGSSDEGGNALAVAGNGDVLLAGYVASSNYPTTAGAYDTGFNSGTFDAFVSRLNGDLTTLVASTYLGSSDMDYVYSMALDTDGDVFVTGWTYSSGFPTTASAFDRSFAGGSDVFVAKLDGSLTSLLASTFLGGAGVDGGNKLAIDASGSVYVAGPTESSGFPVTAGAYDTDHNGGVDVFISKLDTDLSALIASTFLGGSAAEQLFGLDAEGSGSVLVVGITSSAEYPTTSAAYDTTYSAGRDIFITRLDGDLSSASASVDDGTRPGSLFLHASHPNPFNPRTTIAFDIAEPTPVSLHVYDLSGRRIRSLLDGRVLSPGRHEIVWDGTDEAGRGVPPGVYLCRVESRGAGETRRLVLVR